MEARERFELALARLYRDKLVREGVVFIEGNEIEALAANEGVPDPLAALILDDLSAKGLIEQDHGLYRGGEQLILSYEQEHDRAAFYESNGARRELLAAAADALDAGEEITFRPDPADNYTARPWNEARAAAHMLQAFGLGKLGEFLGGNFVFSVTVNGYELARDSAALASALPISADEDAVMNTNDSTGGATNDPTSAAERDGRPGVFISYSHHDQEFVLALVAALKTQGVRVWIDQLELDIGDSLIGRLTEAIVEEDFVVAVVSEHSVDSGWCQKEVALAVTEGINNKQVKVLPVRLGDVEMPAALRDLVWGKADPGVSPADLAAGLARSINRQVSRRNGGGTAVEETTPSEAFASTEGLAYDAAATAAAIDEVYGLLVEVVAQWDRCRSAGGATADLLSVQRPMRYKFDLLPAEVRQALPLVALIAQSEWQDFFRLRDYREMEMEVDEEIRAARSAVAQDLPLVPRWTIVGTDGIVSSGDRDATAYLWWIERGGNSRPVTVFISGSAVASDNAGLPGEVRAAKETEGRSVVVNLLAIDDPPRQLMVSTSGVSWVTEDPE